MNNFLWRGTAPDGAIRTEKVAAENAQAAKAMLVEQGWSGLQLLTDEICDVAGQLTAKPEETEEEAPEFTAEEEARFFEGKGPGFWPAYWQTLSETALILLAVTGLTAWGFYRERWWLVTLCGATLAFMVLLFPAASAFYSLPGRYYARLNRAKVWSRWEEVLRCVEWLRQIQRLAHFGPGDLELTRCRAQALAALGRLDEGLAEFARFADDPAVPAWMYLTSLAGIHDRAKNYEQALEYRRQAAAAKPETATMWIDVTYSLVHSLNRPAEARAALARAETLELTTMAVPYVSFMHGLICWREGGFTEAKGHFEQALAGFKAFAHSPLMEDVVLLNKAYLCATLGALGDLPAARKYLRQTERYLEASRERELLAACRGPFAGAR